MPKRNFINKDMESTILKIIILRKTSNSKVNSYTLLKDIGADKRFVKRYGSFGKIKSEVYNAINSLERSGHIKSSQKVENGRLKNYYTLTKKGTQVLKSAKKVFEKNFRDLKSLLSE